MNQKQAKDRLKKIIEEVAEELKSIEGEEKISPLELKKIYTRKSDVKISEEEIEILCYGFEYIDEFVEGSIKTKKDEKVERLYV